VSVAAPVKRLAAWAFLRSRASRLPVFSRGRAILLVYHRVNDVGDPFFPALGRASFAAQLDHLARSYRVEPLDQVLDWLAAGAKGRARVSITIDDGYPDTASLVLPELERRRLPATLFLSTAPLETHQPLWTDRIRWLLKHASVDVLKTPWRGLERLSLESTSARVSAVAILLARLKTLTADGVQDAERLLESSLRARGEPLRAITWDDVRRMVAGPIRLGAHTDHHFILSRLEESQQEVEVATSMRVIEARTGRPVTTFAYPNGGAADYDDRTVAVVRRLGLRCALTTRSESARPGDDPFQLPRLHTNSPSLGLFAARLAGLSPAERPEARTA